MASPAGAGASTSGSGGEGTPFSVQLRSLERRVAGMGGIPGEQRVCGVPPRLLPAAGNMVWGPWWRCPVAAPADGLACALCTCPPAHLNVPPHPACSPHLAALGACVLPRMTPGMRPQLAATASPAAVEIMQRRLGGEENATPLRKTGSGEHEAAHTPLVQLRHTPAPAGKPAGSPLGAAAPNSELAAAIQRRMQRLGSASPEKDTAAAAVEAS